MTVDLNRGGISGGPGGGTDRVPYRRVRVIFLKIKLGLGRHPGPFLIRTL
jgi:hypothetical protein